eukprot:RCo043089
MSLPVGMQPDGALPFPWMEGLFHARSVEPLSLGLLVAETDAFPRPPSPKTVPAPTIPAPAIPVSLPAPRVSSRGLLQELAAQEQNLAELRQKATSALPAEAIRSSGENHGPSAGALPKERAGSGVCCCCSGGCVGGTASQEVAAAVDGEGKSPRSSLTDIARSLVMGYNTAAVGCFRRGDYQSAVVLLFRAAHLTESPECDDLWQSQPPLPSLQPYALDGG